MKSCLFIGQRKIGNGLVIQILGCISKRQIYSKLNHVYLVILSRCEEGMGVVQGSAPNLGLSVGSLHVLPVLCYCGPNTCILCQLLTLDYDEVTFR